MAIRLAIRPKPGSEHLLPAAKDAGFEAAEVGADALSAASTAGMSVACVWMDATLHPKDRRTWDRQRDQIVRAIAAAKSAGAACVRVQAGELQKGESFSAAVGIIAERLGTLVAAAEAAGVAIAIENSGSFRGAKDLWRLLESAPHRYVGVCLDATSGESPALLVPTLNRRIVHVHVWDHKGGAPVALGQGEAKNRLLCERLRGIGYAGACSYAPPAGADLGDVEGLKAAAHQLKLWLGLIKPEEPKAEPAKAEVKPAPATKG